MTTVRYLTADQVLALHTLALTIGNPGGEGIRSEHALLSAIFQARQTFGGEDLYPTIPEKAAAYAYFIAEGQPFVNGNKRTGALAMTVFLDLNGYDLHETGDEELAVVLEDVGKHVIDQSEFFGWVCNHAKPQQREGL